MTQPDPHPILSRGGRRDRDSARSEFSFPQPRRASGRRAVALRGVLTNAARVALRSGHYGNPCAATRTRQFRRSLTRSSNAALAWLLPRPPTETQVPRPRRASYTTACWEFQRCPRRGSSFGPLKLESGGLGAERVLAANELERGSAGKVMSSATVLTLRADRGSPLIANPETLGGFAVRRWATSFGAIEPVFVRSTP
jgi:hypothetical protein